MENFEITITDPNLFEAELADCLRQILIEDVTFGVEVPQLEEIISEILGRHTSRVREVSPRSRRAFTTAFKNSFY